MARKGNPLQRYDGAPLALLAQWLRLLDFEVELLSQILRLADELRLDHDQYLDGLSGSLNSDKVQKI